LKFTDGAAFSYTDSEFEMKFKDGGTITHRDGDLEFDIKGEITSMCENSQGNINSTHLVTFKNGETEKKYLLQKINNSVFKNPFLVMRNISLVTNHIKKKLSTMEGVNQKTLTLIPTVKKPNEFLYIYTNSDGEKEYYAGYKLTDYREEVAEMYMIISEEE